jgi:hypothetical protein
VPHRQQVADGLDTKVWRPAPKLKISESADYGLF